MKDKGSKDVKKLQQSLHHIAAQNTLLCGEVRGLRRSLAIKERRPKQSFTLQLDEDEVYHGEQKSGRLGVYNELAIVGHHNNNNNNKSLKSFKKLSKPRLTRQLAFASFNYNGRTVLSGRGSGMRTESGRLQRKLEETFNRASATLKKLYNCPKRVSVKLQNLISQLQSVRNVLGVVQLQYS